jgi:hypothetical protein
VWDQLKPSDIERVKAELGERRAEMLARHAEELRNSTPNRTNSTPWSRRSTCSCGKEPVLAGRRRIKLDRLARVALGECRDGDTAQLFISGAGRNIGERPRLELARRGCSLIINGGAQPRDL